MRISRRALLGAATGGFLFGDQAEAQSGSIPSTTHLPGLSPVQEGLLDAQFEVPTDISLNKDAVFQYLISKTDLQSLDKTLVLVLAKTTAKQGETLTSENTYWVIQLFPCLGGTCSPTSQFFSDDVPKWFPIGWTFERNANYLEAFDFQNFFLCFGSSTAGGGFTCKAYSNFFDILGNQINSNAPINDGKSPQGSTPGLRGDASGSTNENGNAVISGQIGDGKGQETSLRPSTPTQTLVLTTQTPFVTYKDIPSTIIPTQTPGPMSTRIGATVTAALSSALTATTTPTSTSIAASAGGSKISTGAIVGIALGVLVLLLILAALAVFFCLRRRRRASGAQKHEQVMLTHAHGENNSQDLLAEKDMSVQHTLIHPNSNDSDFSRHTRNPSDSALRQTLIPAGGIAYDSSDRAHEGTSNALTTGGYRDEDETREIQVSPSDRESHSHSHTDTTPTPFIASSTINSAPRRKPTNASTAPSAVSALSRNTSTSTTASRQSLEYPPHHSHLQDIGEEPTSNSGSAHFSDGQARYGETRHTPTFHTGANGAGGVSIVPSGAIPAESGSRGSPIGTSALFSEPGMSAEEAARFEEEERRIDLAIAEAERSRGQR